MIRVIVITLLFFLFVKFIIMIGIIIGLIHRAVFFSMLAAVCGLFILGLSFRTVS